MVWDKIHCRFPVNGNYIWLNNCGTTPASGDVVKSMRDFMEAYSLQGVLAKSYPYARIRAQILDKLSNLLNCKPGELALINNTAQGMNYISHGLRLKKGDGILLLEQEYPSNVYPWEHWTKKGIKVDFIPMAPNPQGFINNFKSKLHSHVKFVSISAVHWCTGMPLPVKHIGDICQSNNISLCLDGAQGVGMMPIDLESSNVSYMVFPAWKWLLGPLGVGVLYIKSSKLNDLNLIFKGTNSVIDSAEYLPYKDKIKPDTERFEISTPNFMDWVYFNTSLCMLERIGFKNVFNRIWQLSDYLTDALSSKGVNLLRSGFPKNKTGIVCFTKPGISSSSLYQWLCRNKVVCALRDNNIRLAPHIYNSFDQLDAVVKLIEEAPAVT